METKGSKKGVESKINRRAFIVLCGLAVGGYKQSLASELSQSGLVVESNEDLEFYKDIFVDRVDGNLILVQGRLIALGGAKNSPKVVVIEFSTDSGFSQVVHRGAKEVGRDGVFLLNYSWRNPFFNSEIYVRLRILGSVVSKKGLVVEKPLTSQIKKISPWD